MRYQGKISGWNDDKGYGFVTPNGGGEKAFVHIKAFTDRQRPVEGALITYELTRDKQNRYQAAAIRYTRTDRNKTNQNWNSIVAYAISGVFGITVTALVVAGKIPVELLFVYFGASCITLMVYAFDKAAAMQQRRRTKESTLHLLGLVGGWPGALIGQRLFRHKTKKVEFQYTFWCSVFINCSVLAWCSTEQGQVLLHSLMQTQ